MSSISHRPSLSDLFNFDEYELAYPNNNDYNYDYPTFDESKESNVYSFLDDIPIPEPFSFVETPVSAGDTSDSGSEAGSSPSLSFSRSSSEVEADVDRFFALCDEDDHLPSVDPYVFDSLDVLCASL